MKNSDLADYHKKIHRGEKPDFNPYKKFDSDFKKTEVSIGVLFCLFAMFCVALGVYVLASFVIGLVY